MMPEGPLNTTSLERKYIVEKILKKLRLSFFKYGLKKVKIEGLEKMMKKNEKSIFPKYQREGQLLLPSDD